MAGDEDHGDDYGASGFDMYKTGKFLGWMSVLMKLAYLFYNSSHYTL